MYKILTMRNCLQFLIVVCMQSLACAKTCCSETRCRCLPLPNHTYEAECLGLSINESTFPKFFNNVESVNLGENNIQRLPFPLLKYLPQSLKKFNISNNHINALRKSSFLHLENLTHLIVKDNFIRYIDKETFSPLLSLQILDLSGNIYLTFRALRNISYGLQFTSIQALHLNFIHCASGITTMIFVSDIKYISNTTLREIYLTGNRLAYFEFGALKMLPKSLSILDVSQNAFATGPWIFDIQSLSGLTLLKIGDKVDFGGDGSFINCHDWRGPIISRFKPKKTKYDWHFNIIFPPSLKEISAADLRLGNNLKRLKISKNNSLETIDLQGNYFSEWIGPITNLHKLKYVDLSGVGGTKIYDNFFNDFPALETLKMNNNIFGPLFTLDKSDKIFQFLTALKDLDISYNSVTTLPVNIFKHLTSLEVLRLSNNYLTDWEVSIATLKNLQYIDLSSNRLSSLQHKTMQEIENLSNRNFSINLKDNVLQCTCGTLTFMKWMIKNSRIFIDFKSYNCQDEKNTISLIRLNSKIEELEKQCSDYVGLTLGVFVAIILCFLISIFGIIYRYRWKLRYMYYLGHSKFKNIKRTDDHQYEFDAFISYANEDRKTVLEIAETLENRYRMKLQFHERDFLGGKGIAENITDTIHRSHKTVVMLSTNFLKSHWGKFEFNMARMESIYARNGDDIIVIVLLEPIKARDLPLMMMDVIQSKAYIEYSDEEQCQILFWEKLERAIQAP